MSTEQHEALIPAPLSRTDIARLWREVSGATRMTQSEEEFARRVERAALEVQHALIVQMAEALQKLDCLGNGAQPGNSTGNVIAQQALAPATQYLTRGPKT